MAEGIVEQREAGRPFLGLGIWPAALLALGLAHFAVGSVARAAISYASPLEPLAIVSRLIPAMSFALSAAILLGIERWPRARSWLVAAAAAFAAYGILELLGELWIWWTNPYNEIAFMENVRGIVFARAVASLVAGAAAPIVAAGALMAAAPISPGNTTRRWAILTLLLAAAAAMAATVPLALFMVDRGPLGWYDIAYYPMLGLADACFAALGAVAIHRMPAHYRMPELLIGVGGGLVAGAGAARSLTTAAWIGSDFSLNVGWMLAVLTVVTLAGLLAVIGGFVTARIVPPRGALPPQRAW